MNLRCFYCQTPFTLGRAEVLAALQQMDSENMNHYDAHCPRCRRANSVARQRLEMFLPNWREVAAEQASIPATAPMTVMPPAPAVPAPSEETAPKANKSSHRKRAGSATKAAAARSTKKPAATKAKPAAKSTTATKEKKTTTKDKKK